MSDILSRFVRSVKSPPNLIIVHLCCQIVCDDVKLLVRFEEKLRLIIQVYIV